MLRSPRACSQPVTVGLPGVLARISRRTCGYANASSCKGTVMSDRIKSVVDFILTTHRPGRFQREGLIDLIRTLRTRPQGEAHVSVVLEHLSRVAPEIDPRDRPRRRLAQEPYIRRAIRSNHHRFPRPQPAAPILQNSVGGS